MKGNDFPAVLEWDRMVTQGCPEASDSIEHDIAMWPARGAPDHFTRLFRGPHIFLGSHDCVPLTWYSWLEAYPLSFPPPKSYRYRSIRKQLRRSQPTLDWVPGSFTPQAGSTMPRSAPIRGPAAAHAWSSRTSERSPGPSCAAGATGLPAGSSWHAPALGSTLPSRTRREAGPLREPASVRVDQALVVSGIGASVIHFRSAA
jgi:hypothetical protein